MGGLLNAIADVADGLRRHHANFKTAKQHSWDNLWDEPRCGVEELWDRLQNWEACIYQVEKGWACKSAVATSHQSSRRHSLS